MSRTLKSIGKGWISVEPKYKEDKPWKKRVVEKERGIFDNVNMSDLREGFNNRTNAKRFSQHVFRQRME